MWTTGWNSEVRILIYFLDNTCLSDIGEFYEGEMKDGRPHGKGSAKYQSGGKYTGEWKEGEKEGYGVYTK